MVPYASIALSSGGGRGFQTLGVLMKKPFQNWKNTIEDFSYHKNTVYHKNYVLKAEDWLVVEKGIIPSVELLQNSALYQQILENRKAIVPSIETVILCGRQGLAFRGHRDHSPFDLEQCPSENEGNFRAILQYRVISGDDALKKYLMTGQKILCRYLRKLRIR